MLTVTDNDTEALVVVRCGVCAFCRLFCARRALDLAALLAAAYAKAGALDIQAQQLKYVNDFFARFSRETE